MYMADRRGHNTCGFRVWQFVGGIILRLPCMARCRGHSVLGLRVWPTVDAIGHQVYSLPSQAIALSFPSTLHLMGVKRSYSFCKLLTNNFQPLLNLYLNCPHTGTVCWTFLNFVELYFLKFCRYRYGRYPVGFMAH